MADEYKVPDPLQPAPAAEPVGDAYSARLFDHDAGKWIEVPAAEVPNRVASGKFTYEAGIQVPMVSPEGGRLSIPSENALAAFKEGFLPVTAALGAAADQVALERSNAKIYGNQPIEAAVGGFLRGATLGLSDVGLNALGLEEGAAQVKDRNPGASLVGEAGGILFSTMYGGPVGQGAKAAVRAAETAATAALGTGRAASVAARAAGAAAEGAYFGFGQGVSEAALGHPESVVDSLIAHTGLGVLVGGVTGGIFAGGAEVAKPAFDKFVNWASKGLADVTDAAARKVVAKGAAPLLPANLRPELEGLLSDPKTLRAVVEMGGIESAEAVAKRELTPLVKAATAERKAIENDLRQALATAKDDSRRVMLDTLDKVGKDVYAAGNLAEQEMLMAQSNMLRIFSSQSGRPLTTNISEIEKKMADTIADLRGIRSAPAQKLANYLDAYKGMTKGITDQASEANYLVTIEQLLQPHLKSKGFGTEVAKLWNYVDQSLLAHPNQMISTIYGANKVYANALGELRDIVDKSLTRTVGNNSDYAADKAFKALLNPQSRAALDAILDNVGSFGSVLKRDVSDAVKQAELHQIIENKIKALAPGSKVNIQQVDDIFTMLGKKNIVNADLTRLAELRMVLSNSANPIDKTIALGRVLGTDIKEIERLARLTDKLSLYSRLKDFDAPSLDTVRSALGGTVGGPLGLLLGLKKGNVQNYVKSVAQLGSTLDAGAKMLSKSVEYATKALTSKPAQKIASATAEAAIGTGKTLSVKEQRARYNAAKTAIEAAQVAPPIERQEVPNIAKALQQRQMQTLKFLKEKMPKDPFQASSINSFNTGYSPSDFEITKFNRYLTAADNPVSVLDSIAKGKATAEEIETLKTLHPRVYNDLQRSVMSAIIDVKGEVSYKQKLALSDLLDIPTDYTLESDFIGRMQASINKSQGGRPEGSGVAPKTIRGRLELSPMETLATSAQAVTYKGQI